MADKRASMQFRITLLIGICILPILAAIPALNAPLYFDDLQNIVVNLWVMDFHPSLKYLLDYIEENRFHRWVAFISFGMDHYIHGGMFVLMRLENMIYHAATALMMWLVMIQFSRINKWDLSPEVLGIGAFLWAINPFIIDTPIYLVQRMSVLAALFVFVAYWFWNKFWEERKIKWMIWAGFSFLIAIASKENAALLLPLWLLDLWLVRRLVSAKWLLVGGSVLIAALYFFGSWTEQEDLFAQIQRIYGDRAFTMEERLLTESRVVWIYLSLFLFPSPDRISFYLAPPLSTGLFAPWTTAAAIAAHVVVVGVAFWFVRKKNYWPAFGILGYYLLHSLESTVIPLQIAFEHRMYLPSAFLVATLWGPFASVMLSAIPTLKWFYGFALLVASVLLTVSTGSRALEWGDNLLFWKEQVAKTPYLPDAWNDYAAALADEGKIPEAIKALDHAISLNGHDMFLIANRIIYCLKWENGAGYEGWWKRLVPLLVHPKLPGGIQGILEALSVELVDHEKYENALTVLRVAGSNRMSPQVMLTLAQLHHQKGEVEQEEDTLRKAVSRYPLEATVVNGMAMFLETHQKHDEAVSLLERAIKFCPFEHKRDLMKQFLKQIQEKHPETSS